jgi:hypothetical protein
MVEQMALKLDELMVELSVGKMVDKLVVKRACLMAAWRAELLDCRWVAPMDEKTAELMVG